MATAITQEPLHLIDVDAIVVALSGSELSGPAQELNTQTKGALQRMIDANEASLNVGITTSWLAPSGIKAPVVMLVGLGNCDSPENISYFKAAGAAAKTLAAKQRDTVAYYFPECDATALETAVSGSLVGCHGQDVCRSKLNLYTPHNILWATSDESTVTKGVVIAQGINLTRDLVNGPPNMVYPETFAEQIQDLGETTSLETEVWDATKLAEEKCGSLLAVAQGSAREARLVIMRYRGADVADPQLALVGKGVTYDSGGLSLKPSDGQKTMKCDMAGAATVVGTMQAISQLNLPCHVIGLVGLVENMVSSKILKEIEIPYNIPDFSHILRTKYPEVVIASREYIGETREIELPEGINPGEFQSQFHIVKYNPIGEDYNVDSELGGESDESNIL